MRKCRVAIGLGMALAIGAARVAGADPILVGDGRVVAAFTTVNNLPPVADDAAPSVPFAPFDEGAIATTTDRDSFGTSSAVQRSSVTPTRFHATASAESVGRASDVGDVVSTGAFSYFGVDFELPIPYRFTLTELMTADAFESNSPDTLVHILIEDAESPILQDGLDGTGTRRLNRTGILLAGFHSLLAQAAANPQLDPIFASDNGALSHQMASFDLDFQLTPVPEPGSIILLSSGLAVFASRRARLRRT